MQRQTSLPPDAPLFEWSDRYALGISEIDRQHRQLFDIINRLGETIGTASEFRQATLTVSDLYRYLCEHFTYEEALLYKADYVALSAQKRQHRAFINQVARFQIQVARRDPKVSREVLSMLTTWLMTHVLRADRLYVEHLPPTLESPQWRCG